MCSAQTSTVYVTHLIGRSGFLRMWRRVIANGLLGSKAIDVLVESIIRDLPELADLDRLDMARCYEAEHVGSADPEQPRGLWDRMQAPAVVAAGCVPLGCHGVCPVFQRRPGQDQATAAVRPMIMPPWSGTCHRL
jgi:hypothetical protein